MLDLVRFSREGLHPSIKVLWRFQKQSLGQKKIFCVWRVSEHETLWSVLCQPCFWLGVLQQRGYTNLGCRCKIIYSASSCKRLEKYQKSSINCSLAGSPQHTYFLMPIPVFYTMRTGHLKQARHGASKLFFLGLKAKLPAWPQGSTGPYVLECIQHVHGSSPQTVCRLVVKQLCVSKKGWKEATSRTYLSYSCWRDLSLSMLHISRK